MFSKPPAKAGIGYMYAVLRLAMGCLIQNVSVFIHPLTDRPLFIFGGGVWNGIAWYGLWYGTRGMVCYGTMGVLHGTGGELAAASAPQSPFGSRQACSSSSAEHH